MVMNNSLKEIAVGSPETNVTTSPSSAKVLESTQPEKNPLKKEEKNHKNLLGKVTIKNSSSFYY